MLPPGGRDHGLPLPATLRSAAATSSGAGGCAGRAAGSAGPGSGQVIRSSPASKGVT